MGNVSSISKDDEFLEEVEENPKRKKSNHLTRNFDEQLKNVNSNLKIIISSNSEIKIPINTYNGTITHKLPQILEKYITQQLWNKIISKIQIITLDGIRKIDKIQVEDSFFSKIYNY